MFSGLNSALPCVELSLNKTTLGEAFNGSSCLRYCFVWRPDSYFREFACMLCMLQAAVIS